MDPDGTRTSTRATLLAAAGQNRWPPAGSYMAATGQDLMTADTRPARRPGAASISRGTYSGPNVFQSSPGPKARRCLVAIAGTTADQTRFQSSPGPKARRCKGNSRSMSRTLQFQSSPGPKARRCRPGRRRTPADSRFQSSPGPKARRCLDTAMLHPTTQMFQSSPGPKARRCLQRRDHQRRGRPVSILARPEGQALRDVERRSAHRHDRFNPRPARRPGAAGLDMEIPETAVMFQSSPGPKARRCLRGRRRARRRQPCFNPRPARRPGAARPRTRCRPSSWRFNPRPARRPGAAQAGVSSSHAAAQFQSSPGPKARRCWCTSTACTPSTCFNPRPARRPGAATPTRC